MGKRNIKREGYGMTTDLIPQNLNPVTLFTNKGLDPVLLEIKKKVDEFIPNLETATGRKEIASLAYKIAQSKTFLDDMGKKLVADRKAEIKLVDDERKRARDFLDSEKERARKPLTEWEQAQAAEEERKRLEDKFNADFDEALHMDELFNREREIKRKEAEFARIEADAKAKADAERLEKERLEREARIRKEAAEKAEREAQEKIEAERLRALKAEADAKAAAEQAERNRIAAEERAKIEAERAEKAKIEAARQAEIDKQIAIKKATEETERKADEKKAAEEREAARLREAAEKQAANKKHQAEINNKILSGLLNLGISEELGKTLIRAVAKGQIENLVIKY
jgi:hypothetical protein